MIYTYEIEHDTSEADDPTEWDNIGHMVTWHRRYSLGHEQPRQEPADWAAEFKRKHPNAVILPLYLYDHGGITISTSEFSCPWDSGQIGYIYTTLERAQEMGFNWKRLNKKRRDQLEADLESDVKTYDQYLRGEVSCYKIKDSNGDIVDSGHGYYDRDDCDSVARETLEWWERQDRKAA